MIFINKSFKDNILSKVHKLSSIPIELSLLIDDGFIVHNNGCVFFKAKQPLDVDNGNFFDKTEEECFYNELRISAYTDDDIVSVAISVSEMITMKLQTTMPLKKFEVITIFDDFDDEMDAVIKFHTLRKEEVMYIDIQHIDEYQQPLYISRTQ
ncbi:hypothetical protein [[Enterobacter] lignolyticus]|uniref:Uncharacterized protein n=1 Tax=Enterobacter lignolyticus (strain SCF1) TaxID=701347 RepID=E3G4S4_ENTLS|nr:hypothetical protein [[Enterobacter] lignolyticus]ADO50542.1 hypothetical protein Entcl_4311 [[Enterobacter] lignolyticus SCF1]